MRANEFIIKEASVFDKVGNWANKQVIGRKAKDRASVAKKNVPSISEALLQILLNQASKISDNQIQKMVAKTMSKALKVDVSAEVSEIVQAMKQDQDNKTIYNLVQDVVADALRKDPSYDNVDPALVAKLKKATANKEPTEARKLILDYVKDLGMSDQETRQLIDAVLGSKVDDEEADAEEQDPGSENRLQKFSAEVFYPEGKYDSRKEGQQIAYINRNGKWSIFRMSGLKQWEFIRNVGNEKSEAKIEALLDRAGLQPIPKSFKYKDQDYYWVN